MLAEPIWQNVKVALEAKFQEITDGCTSRKIVTRNDNGTR